MQASPIGWVGGKSRLRKTILDRIPDHTCYVELFAGAAWICFAKPKEMSKVEVINDTNGELSNFWRCVRDKHLELIEKLRFRIASKQDFEMIKQSGGGGGGGGGCVSDLPEVDRAAIFYWHLKNAYAGKHGARTQFAYAPSGPANLRSYDRVIHSLQQAHKRLEGVYIFNEDFELVIDSFDRPETFFYCDPPYHGSERYYATSDFSDHHKRLAERLKRIKGQFLLRYNDHEAIRNLYDWATIETADTSYSYGNNRTRSGLLTVSELLLSNYR